MLGFCNLYRKTSNPIKFVFEPGWRLVCLEPLSERCTVKQVCFVGHVSYGPLRSAISFKRMSLRQSYDRGYD